MLRAARAELSYGAAGVAVWLGALLLFSSWPLLERPEVRSIGTVLAAMTVLLPIVGLVSALQLLGLEQREHRARLFASLPLSASNVASARLLRTAAVPLTAVVAAGLLVSAGLLLDAGALTGHLPNPWILLFWTQLALAATVLATLLYDLRGMTFAQVALFLLGALAALLNSAFPTAGQAVLGTLTELVQGPAGWLLTALLTGALWAADVALYARKGGRG